MRYIFAIPLLAALASTQTINPTSVPLATRQSWCTSQKASCPLLCLDQTGSASTESNVCDATTLDWACVCGNGVAPNATQYSETIPYYECTEFDTQCVTACGQDNTCAAACRQEHPCGASNPSRVSSIASSTASQTSSGTGSAATTGYGSFGGSSGSDGSSSTNKSNAALRVTAIDVGHTFGLAAVVGGLLLGFGIML